MGAVEPLGKKFSVPAKIITIIKQLARKKLLMPNGSLAIVQKLLELLPNRFSAIDGLSYGGLRRTANVFAFS